MNRIEKTKDSHARASQFVPEICENEVVDLLKEIQQKLQAYNTDHENLFSAEQNALITVNAEKYYRAMIKGGPRSWNVRDGHMAVPWIDIDETTALHPIHIKPGGHLVLETYPFGE